MDKLTKKFRNFFSWRRRSKAKVIAKPDYEASAEEILVESSEPPKSENAQQDEAVVPVRGNEVVLVEPLSSTGTSSKSGEDLKNDNAAAAGPSTAGTDVCDGLQDTPRLSQGDLMTDGWVGPTSSGDSSEDYSESEDDDDEPLRAVQVQMDSGPPARTTIESSLYVFAIQVREPEEASDERGEDDAAVPVTVTENSSSHDAVTEEEKPEEPNDNEVQAAQYLMDGDHLDQHEMSHSLALFPQENSGDLSAQLDESNMDYNDPIEGDVASLGEGSYEYTDSLYANDADYDYESS